MTTFFLLWILATVDAAFIGYREAAGRNALIDKGRYYRWAMVRGALLGQIAVGVVGAFAIVILAFSADRSSLIGQFEDMGTRMLTVFVPYALILFLAFLVRLMPSVDLRSITSVIIFGPFTLIRPVVVIAGIIWGLLYGPNWITILLAALILFLMLGFEWAIGKRRLLD
jgi:hypothetical protein